MSHSIVSHKDLSKSICLLHFVTSSCSDSLIMAEMKTITIVPLIGSNYPTWKVQCRMALVKDGLWGIVNESERPPDETTQADKYAKFVARRDRALAIIVLAVDPSLLYLLGDPDNPVTVRKKLENQFQKKTWCNKLELCRKLYSLHLKAGSSVQEHIKAMTEIFESLSVIGDPVSEEDRVVYLLASLPDCYNMLVTALDEANQDVPQMEVVTKRQLHEECKLNDRSSSSGTTKAMKAYRHKRNVIICYYCGKLDTSSVIVVYLLQMREKLILAANAKVIQSSRLWLTKPLYKTLKMTPVRVVIVML